MSERDLLSSLATGPAVAEGAFTVDREKAREKLRHFQLADPCAWLLEAVRAAVVQGATKVSVDTDADDVRIHFDGPPFTQADIDELYGALLSQNAPPARQHLAVALNGAMALEPRFVKIEPGTEYGALSLEMRRGQPDKLGKLRPEKVGTSIHVRQRFRAGHFVEFFRARAGTQREQHALRTACAHAPELAVFINGRRLARAKTAGHT